MLLFPFLVLCLFDPLICLTNLNVKKIYSTRLNSLLQRELYTSELSDFTNAQLSRHEVMVLINELRQQSTRENAIERILQSISNPLSELDCKTLLVASVETRSVPLTSRLIDRFIIEDRLSSELLYVGIRTACRRSAPQIAYLLLLKVCNYDLSVDSDTANAVVQSLTKHGLLDEAWTILEKLINSEFGNDVVADYDTFASIINCSGRLNKLNDMLKALRMLVSTVEFEPKDVIFLKSMYYCSLIGDSTTALRVFQLFHDSYNEIPVQMFSLALMAFMTHASDEISCENSALDNNLATRDSEFITLTPIIKTIRADALEMNDPSLSNLILQYYCKLNAFPEANDYFQLILSKAKPLSNSALLKYGEAVCYAADNAAACNLYDFMVSKGLFPLPKIASLALTALVNTVPDEGSLNRTLQLLTYTLKYGQRPAAHESSEGRCQWPTIEFLYDILLLVIESGRGSDLVTVLQGVSYSVLPHESTMNFPLLLNIVELVSNGIPQSLVSETALQVLSYIFLTVAGSPGFQESFHDFCAICTASPLTLRVDANTLRSGTRREVLRQSRRDSTTAAASHVMLDWDDYRAYGCLALAEVWLRTGYEGSALSLVQDCISTGMMPPTQLITAFLNVVSHANSSTVVAFEDLFRDTGVTIISRPVIHIHRPLTESSHSVLSEIDISDELIVTEQVSLIQDDVVIRLEIVEREPDYNESVYTHFQKMIGLSAPLRQSPSDESDSMSRPTSRAVIDYYRDHISGSPADGHPKLADIYLDALLLERSCEEALRIVRSVVAHISSSHYIELYSKSSGKSLSSVLRKSLEIILSCSRPEEAFEVIDLCSLAKIVVSKEDLEFIIRIPETMQPPRPDLIFDLFCALYPISNFTDALSHGTVPDDSIFDSPLLMSTLVTALTRATDRVSYTRLAKLLAPVLVQSTRCNLPVHVLLGLTTASITDGDLESAVTFLLRLPPLPRHLPIFAKAAKLLAVVNASQRLEVPVSGASYGPRVDLLMNLLARVESSPQIYVPITMFSIIACALSGLQRRVLMFVRGITDLKLSRSADMPHSPPWLQSFILLAVAQDTPEVGHDSKKVLQEWSGATGLKPQSELELNLYLIGLLRGIMFEHKTLIENEEAETAGVPASGLKSSRNSTDVNTKLSKLIRLTQQTLRVIKDKALGLHQRNKRFSFDGFKSNEIQGIVRQMHVLPEVDSPTCKIRIMKRRGSTATMSAEELVNVTNDVYQCTDGSIRKVYDSDIASDTYEYDEALKISPDEIDHMDLMSYLDVRPSEHMLIAVSRSNLRTLKDEFRRLKFCDSSSNTSIEEAALGGR